MSDERLAEAGALLERMAERVFGDGGVTRQIATGEWNGSLSDEAKFDLAELLEVTAERVRWTRQHAAGLEPASRAVDLVAGHAAGDPTWLPLNRKERYYTGTVLPMLVASDGFAHLHRFLELCGLPEVSIEKSLETMRELTFYTEYGFAESVFTDTDKLAWPDLLNADTPDVVIAGPDWLVAVEAKMFHNPNASALEAQMGRQAKLVDYWATTRGLDPLRVRHVLLLPEPLAERVGSLQYPVVTWEQVLQRYDIVGPRYWARALAVALARHPELQSRLGTGGKNADDVLTGEAIVAAHAEGSNQFDQIGRSGGLTGTSFASDIASGAWRTVSYEVRQGALPGNRNWFPMADFITATGGTPPPVAEE
ncbi:hypothetical protein [Nocardioides aquaticus]|nr:hypothetical protein [Nocardioides aquaticus]